MAPKKKLFALIWWLNSAYKDTIQLSLIPKNQRKVKSLITLTWNDHQTGRKTKAEAKILAINGNYSSCIFTKTLFDTLNVIRGKNISMYM